jgi:hypothetical protein
MEQIGKAYDDLGIIYLKFAMSTLALTLAKNDSLYLIFTVCYINNFIENKFLSHFFIYVNFLVSS